MSEQDWQRERESLYVLQNTDLMQQIATSLNTYTQGKAYQPTPEQMDEILGV